MLAAIAKVSSVVESNAFIQDMEASFEYKFASKPQAIEGEYVLSYKPKDKKPIEEYLKLQGRFAHMFKAGNERTIEQDWKGVNRN